MKTNPESSSNPPARAAVDAFLDHLVTCGHCQSFPRSLCATGVTLQKKVAPVLAKRGVVRGRLVEPGERNGRDRERETRDNASAA